jgi:chromate transporter
VSNQQATHSVDNNTVNARSVFRLFLTLGLTSFGGPIAHIGYFHQAVVTQRKWLTDAQFAQLLAVCQAIPGPASSQLSFAIGYHRASWLGALAAFIAFTLPSAVLLFALVSYLPHAPPLVTNVLISALKLVAVVVVADAIINMARKLWHSRVTCLIGVLCASGLIVFHHSGAPLIAIALAGLIGFFYCSPDIANNTDASLRCPSASVSLSSFILFVMLLLLLPWFSSPLVSLFSDFYQSGALVFGGGHVVLPLLEQQLINEGWMQQQDFLAGYGAAQAVPGPLFTIATYLGALFPHSPAYMGALVATVGIFLPGFLLLVTALRSWQTLYEYPNVSAAIAGVNAGVVGLLIAAFVDPVLPAGVLSIWDGLIAIGILIALQSKRLSPLWAVLICIIYKGLGALL